jgi:hemoglobin
MTTPTRFPASTAALLALLALGAACLAPHVSAQQAPARSGAGAATTLYTRLGGYDFLAGFVDTAFPRVAANPRLARLFRGHSLDSQRRQRQLIVDALCQYTGGPCIYIGRDLTAVHQGLGITAEDWTTFMEIIAGALEETGAPREVRAELVRLFEERLRPTVVVP